MTENRLNVIIIVTIIVIFIINVTEGTSLAL